MIRMSLMKILEEEYMKKHPRSRNLYSRALKCFASGVTHDGRYVKPFPIYMVKADGAKKWDVDGNEYIDYVMGHGALLFGYNDKRLRRAVESVLSNIHMGSCTELEIEWAEMIKKLVPCARDGFVRACACGSEAIAMAVRLARVHTGRDKIVVHEGCYHGKWESVILAHNGPPYGLCNTRGIPKSVGENTIIIPYNKPEIVEKVFATGDVACIILQGNAPYTKEYMKELRELTEKYGVVFILDEVVSGFRYAAGGAQEYYGVTPDLAVLGKIVGGGAPIGAICGSRELLQYYEFRDDEYWNRFVRISIGGTWNAQPICISAGLEAMKIIDMERNEIYPRLYKICERLVDSIVKCAEEAGIRVSVGGTPPERPMAYIHPKFADGSSPLAAYAFYLSMTNNGVFPYRTGRFVPCVKHSDEDLNRTENAMRKAMEVLKKDNLVPSCDS
ncbi:aspartate aminotransferase family protein [Candidatus Bathyarchaeota archaeon]|nr:MAG: aspartate aminotransferase family protein [Candidatus Bathyarchaeota archaeon]